MSEKWVRGEFKRIILACFLLLILSGKAFSADYYAVGVDAFKKGCYASAEFNLEHAVRINPNNVNARYYLSQVYLKQNNIDDAKTQYKRILILSPSSDAGILAQKGLSLIVQANNSKGKIAAIDKFGNYKDNYLDYVVSDAGYLQKWESFPISVYIQSNKNKSTAQRAFMQWQEKSNNLISFKFINNPTQAKITVDFKSKLESTSTKEGFFAGFTKPYYRGEYLSKAEMHILTTDPQTHQDFNETFIYATVLHESGHALGFIGHSPNDNDVMAAITSTPKTNLTQRDINTLILFYSVDNTTYLARQKGGTGVKLQEAMDYIKKMPKKSIGWSNLGDIYIGKKMYPDAIRSYQKAISLEPDRANPYSSLGVAYRYSGDKQNAYLNFKKACDLDKTNPMYISQLAAICTELNRKNIAKTYLNNYLKLNPQGASDGNIN